MTWEEAQKFEKEWWGNPVNTIHEEEKQMYLAPLMGLKVLKNPYTPYNIDVKNTSILDIGGGPSSILLKCLNLAKGKVVEPIKHPDWVIERYKSFNIEFENIKGEDLNEKGWDCVLIYNVLQHVENPEKIIKNAQRAGKIIRLFEWIDTPISPGHIHTLTEDNLNKWLGGEGKVYNLNQHGLVGRAYAGVFLGNDYDKKAKGVLYVSRNWANTSSM